MHCCAFCGHETQEILDFGDVALAGGFLKPSQFHVEKKYPLKLVFCPCCYAVQLADKVDAKTLFGSYFYFSSQIEAVRKHFSGYVQDVSARVNTDTVLEIGCNDGYLLGKFADQGSECIGVDPAKNVIESISDDRLELVNEFFTEEVAQSIISKHGKRKLILANNVFAHIPDIHGVTKAICEVMDNDGVLVVETHHLGAMIEGMQYDWIYHEHLYYYSALSLSSHLAFHGMEIFGVQDLASHGGSKRYYICKTGAHKVSQSVADLMKAELWQGLDKIETFYTFARKVKTHKIELLELVEQLRKDGKTVCGYGASGRANTILQWVGLDARHLSYIIDDAPAKAGYFTPGTHLPIYPSSSVKVTPMTHTLVLAWPYAADILKKVENEAIIPLPTINHHRRLAA